MKERAFKQVDVFSSYLHGGNAVAVVLEAEDLSDEQMQRFAAWTNLAETAFVFPAKNPDADYALRIFTNSRELPFAGHPTLGSCHAWLEHGGTPKDTSGKYIIQECEVGLVRIRRDDCATVKDAVKTLSFNAPPLMKRGPLDSTELRSIVNALGLLESDVIAHSWCVNGPQWRCLLLKSSEHVLAVEPNQVLLGEKDVGIIGPKLTSMEHLPSVQYDYDFEVRAFCPLDSPFEDPATGSLNGGLAYWLINDGLAPSSGYVVRQGTAVGRTGQIIVTVDNRVSGDNYSKEDYVWIGGCCTTCINGTTLFN